MTGPVIRPRAEWAGDLAPTGPLSPEEPRVLLVHHTVNANDYAAEAVPGLLRSIYGLHTGPEKGWPDVAYNFFVDRFGTIWEGRQGSAAGPVRGDATGGNQGSTQLCCFVGDHRVEPPTPAAQEAMIALLAHLAARDGIDVSPGATATFTSLGSNLHPAGATVTSPTIAGHRDMSATECPGDAAYALVTGRFRTDVSARVASPPPTTTTTAPPPTTEAATTTAPSTTTTSTTTTSAPTTSSTTPASATAEERAVGATPTTGDGTGGLARWSPAAAVATGTAAALAALVALRRRRT